ncbi:hypothetical protein [Rhodococcus oxybenzonivorans]|nr:hypothetical protein [Rhodococcus oxybenzonivorans]
MSSQIVTQFVLRFGGPLDDFDALGASVLDQVGDPVDRLEERRKPGR